MPTPAERQALLFVAAVAALGVGVRGCRSLAPSSRETSDRTALALQIAAVDSAVVAGGARRPSGVRRPRAPKVSTAVSPALSAAVSPAVAPAVAPAVGPASATAAATAGPREGARTEARPAHPPAGASGLTAPVDVDRADASELDRLPGIGPALAGRIVADREQRGPFGSLRALERVKGIGPALSARLAPHVTFSLSPRPSETEVPPATRVSSP
ncbi:MAG: helix-hairpin-helix domain-containing protein [Gemmatimonadetes bacterium]|nr:helix-hairpin-helix domain-containing protein [Gemmatimonadota bacterium]